MVSKRWRKRPVTSSSQVWNMTVVVVTQSCQLWIPEAARLLRPDGRLVFLTISTLAYLCSPDEGLVGGALRRPQFGMSRIKWSDESDGTEYHLSHGDWIRLLRANGFDVENLIEVQAPADAKSPVYYDFVTAEWGRQWPAEEIWVARKRS